MTTCTDKSGDVAKVALMMKFMETFDKNLEARGFALEQRKAIIGVMMDTKVDPEVAEAAAAHE